MESTAKQRAYALARGILRPENLSGIELSKAFDRSKEHLSGPPLEIQLSMAKGLRMVSHPTENGWELAGRIYQHFLAKAWIYSVFRKCTGSTWSTHAESRLQDDYVTQLAASIIADDTLRSELESLTFTDARSGDIWYRISSTTQKLAIFTGIKALIPEETSHQSPSSRPQSKSNHQPATKPRTKKGCVLVIVILLLPVLAGSAALYIWA
jgi:hypothetical protein